MTQRCTVTPDVGNVERRDAVLVEALRPGRVELGVEVIDGGRAVWVPNPDADPDLHESFRARVAAARCAPVA